MIVEYSSIGTTVSDFHVMDWARKTWENNKKNKENVLSVITVSSQIAIHAFQVLVKEGFIPYNEISFLYNGKSIFIDRNGTFSNHPVGFCDTYSDILSKLI